MKKTLNFAQNPEGLWEATATEIIGAWQLYVQLPDHDSGVKVYTKAADDEEWSLAGYDSGKDSDPSICVMPFVSIVTEQVKVETKTQPVNANIRQED